MEYSTVEIEKPKEDKPSPSKPLLPNPPPPQVIIQPIYIPQYFLQPILMIPIQHLFYRIM